MSMLRTLSLVTTSFAIFMFSGCCCGPYGGCGVGGYAGCTTNCNDCDGANPYGPPMAYGPLHHLTQMRKSLVCGGGCGEVYWGEWQSSPPDACDPCCDDQFVGGAVPCEPFCWQWRPGQFLFGTISALYGRRYCDGCGNAFDACGCDFMGSQGGVTNGGCGCDGSVSANSESGCSTCNSSSAAGKSTRIATPMTSKQNRRTARSNAMHRGVSSTDGMRPTQYR